MSISVLIRRIPHKMNLDLFCQRIKQADEKILLLRTQVQKMKQRSINLAIQQKEEKLEKENRLLQQQVECLKNQLIEAEIRNGKIQIPLPSGRVSTTRAPEPTAEKVTVSAPVEPEKKKQKAEKPKKKAATQKPKPDAAPVDVSRLDFRIGRIIKAEKHPNADTLYIEEVETGEEQHRTVISGLVQHIPIEEMQNRLVILMMNLKPVKMRGIFSQAMVMCASTPEKVEILIPPEGSVPGDRVSFEGYPGEPDAQLNPKKKVWEQVSPDLRVDDNKVACYKGVPFTVAGKGVCIAPTMSNCAVK